jgi:hypothetical protein
MKILLNFSSHIQQPKFPISTVWKSLNISPNSSTIKSSKCNEKTFLFVCYSPGKVWWKIDRPRAAFLFEKSPNNAISFYASLDDFHPIIPPGWADTWLLQHSPAAFADRRISVYPIFATRTHVVALKAKRKRLSIWNNLFMAEKFDFKLCWGLFLEVLLYWLEWINTKFCVFRILRTQGKAQFSVFISFNIFLMNFHAKTADDSKSFHCFFVGSAILSLFCISAPQF